MEKKERRREREMREREKIEREVKRGAEIEKWITI